MTSVYQGPFRHSPEQAVPSSRWMIKDSTYCAVGSKKTAPALSMAQILGLLNLAFVKSMLWMLTVQCIREWEGFYGPMLGLCEQPDWLFTIPSVASILGRDLKVSFVHSKEWPSPKSPATNLLLTIIRPYTFAGLLPSCSLMRLKLSPPPWPCTKISPCPPYWVLFEGRHNLHLPLSPLQTYRALMNSFINLFINRFLL